MLENVIDLAESLPGCKPLTVHTKRFNFADRSIESSVWFIECVGTIDEITFWCLRCPDCNPLATPLRGDAALGDLHSHARIHGWDI